MGALTFPLILLVIVGIFGVIFFVVTKKQEKASNLLAKNTNTGNKNSKNIKNDVKSEEIKKEDVFKFMEFDRVLDSMIVQNNGSKFTMAIKCKGINYDLMSDVEQISVEEGFITFLNTLRYPIQLYVQAQNVDLKGVIQEYKNNISSVRSDFERLDDEYNKVVESFDSTHQEIERVENERNKVLNVYEYAADIINYVERMSTNKSLLQRNFYVLVSYRSSEIAGLDKFSKEEILNICYTELLTRAQGIINGLSACSVEGRVLDSNEVADLLYMAYNRDDKGLLSVKEAIDSGFYRLYSTSDEAFFKRSEMLNEQIEQEAKIKSLSALKKAIERGEYATPKQKEIEVTERIAREASEMIKHEDLPEQIKKEAQDNIAKEFRETKKNLIQEAAIERTEILERIESVTETDKGKDVLKKEEEKRLEEELKEKEQLQKANEDVKIETDDEQESIKPSIPKNLILDEDANEGKEAISNPIENDFSSFDDRLGATSDDDDDVIR
ncbi:MAG: hypothetical protein PHP54_06160 [Clostridia bacterium]|nr:hypothetical protein [Clostridia bacterium]